MGPYTSKYIDRSITRKIITIIEAIALIVKKNSPRDNKWKIFSITQYEIAERVDKNYLK